MTIEQAIRDLRALSDQLDDSLTGGLDDVLDLGLDLARAASSGTLSYAEMARQDHPYAKRHRTVRQPGYIINRHTGEFYAGWRKEGLSIINDSSHARFMGGTSTMVARPIDAYIALQMEQSIRRMIEYRLRRVV